MEGDEVEVGGGCGREEQEEEAFEEGKPAEDGYGDGKCAAGPDVVGENNSETGGHDDDAHEEEQRGVVDQSDDHVDGDLFVGDHGQGDEEKIEAEQAAKKYSARGQNVLQRNSIC